MNPSTPQEYCFGAFRQLPSQRQLLEGNVPVKLGGRSFDMLVTLVEQHDRALSKRELMDKVWPKLVVEENNLQVQIVALRKALGPGAIATIPGRGYRFVLPLRSASTASEHAPAILPASVPAPPAHGLLSGTERTVFRRAGVFVGSFAIDAAQAAARGWTTVVCGRDARGQHMAGALCRSRLGHGDAGKSARGETLKEWEMAIRARVIEYLRERTQDWSSVERWMREAQHCSIAMLMRTSSARRAHASMPVLRAEMIRPSCTGENALRIPLPFDRRLRTRTSLMHSRCAFPGLWLARRMHADRSCASS